MATYDSKRFLRRALGIALLSGVAASLPVGASTTDPGITFVGTTGIPEAVTVFTSASQDTPKTWVAYVVTHQNNGGSQLRQIKITGSTSTNPAKPSPLPNPAPFYLDQTSAEIIEVVGTQDSAGNELPPCTFAGTSFTCNYETHTIDGSPYVLNPGNFITFVVIVKTPVAFNYSPALFSTNTVGQVLLNLRATSREGKSNNASDSSLGETIGLMSSDVTKLSYQSVTSLVLKNRQSDFFTGAGKTTTDPTDPYVTKIGVPNTPAIKNLTKLKVVESPVLPDDNLDCKNGRNFSTCYNSQIDITEPGTTGGYAPVTLPVGTYFNFELRVGPTSIRNGLNTDKVRVIHDGSEIGYCTLTSQSGATPATYLSLPCIDGMTYYKNSRVNGWTEELDGVLQIKLLGDKNGLWSVR